ncbi:hypothetical protein WOLCODRAFT_155082 [Wolfiporia cocos MD-104 SS10]|uniref:ribonuclease Z n=1 Tax=Wolfiporia cocos (strain MD-104) TaxID=742152 RepID=A0A2H3K9H6_WOLCO|nr:hypothetical protein WOLCODRAFT_155082 [Wolfiporia cocos MD-104 SS10]
MATATNWSTTVLSTATSDTEPTIVVTFDSAKYIFNAGENTGRAWIQSRGNFRKARAIFLTSVGTQRCSGLAGLFMFLADANNRGVKVAGPQGLTHYVASMRFFTKRPAMSVSVTDAPSVSAGSEAVPIYKDENITVYGVPISASMPTHVPSDTSSQTIPAKRKRSPSPDAPAKRSHHSESTNVQGSTMRHPLVKRIIEGKIAPLQLIGEDAEEWRRLMIHLMFPQAPLTAEQEREERQKARKLARQQQKRKAEDNPEGKAKELEEEPEPTPSTSQRQWDPLSANRNRRLPQFDPEGNLPRDQTLCYILVGPRSRGKFDAKKADELGVFRADRAKLTKGQSVVVTVDDGDGNKIERIVLPEDCVAPPESPQVLLLLDVPSPEHIPSLVASFENNPFYAKFRSKSAKDRSEYSVHVVSHLCGPGVLGDESYKAFMQGFADDTHHVVSSREHNADPVTFTSAAYAQVRLNKLDADMFPLPHFSVSPRRDLASVTGLPKNSILMASNSVVDMRPPRAPRPDNETLSYDHFHPAMASGSSLKSPKAIAKQIANVQSKVQLYASTHDADHQPGDDVEIVPLGTSSAVPNKYRNVSGILVRIPHSGSILLDAGEGTWGQLARLYGDDLDHYNSGAWEILRDLRCIYLSHLHGDHHIGAAKILAMRKLLKPPPTMPLFVVATRPALVYLYEQAELEDLGLNSDPATGVNIILSDALHWKKPYAFAYSMKDRNHESFMNEDEACRSAVEMCRSLNLKDFTTIDVAHKTRCYGVKLEHNDGWSIVYSADTAPTENLVEAGRNTTLLIHEASMADEEEEMAAAKAHSTASQAIGIGTSMNAKNILLTHFSARYPKILPLVMNPPGSPSEDTPGPVVALALDHARFTIKDMRKLHVYQPAIERTFAVTAAEEGDPEDDRTSISW